MSGGEGAGVGDDDHGEERTLLVDASVIITLAEIDIFSLLYGLEGSVVVPETVVGEVTDEPARSALMDGFKRGDIVEMKASDNVSDAAAHLEAPAVDCAGDVALLALGLQKGSPVIVTDDKPLRKACKALSIPVSGSIGVLIRAVERGELDADVATDKLYAMDEVGARMSASLVRKAERLIEEAGDI